MPEKFEDRHEDADDFRPDFGPFKEGAETEPSFMPDFGTDTFNVNGNRGVVLLDVGNAGCFGRFENSVKGTDEVPQFHFLDEVGGGIFA